GSRRDTRQDLSEIEWHRLGVFAVQDADAGHIAAVAPSIEITAGVCKKGIESAACDYGFYTRVERPREQRVVAAERMADDADFIAVDLGKRLEQIHRSHVFPNVFHGCARVAHG